MFPKILKIKSRPSKSIISSVLIFMASILAYVMHDTCVKLLSPAVKLNHIIFFRSAFALVPVLLLAILEVKKYQSYRKVFQTNFIQAHLLRCCVFSLSLLFYIFSCRILPLPEVYALSYCSPCFVTIFSFILLKEKISLQRLIFILIGFVGVIIILRPGSGCFKIQALTPILSGLFTALSIVWGRQLSFVDSNSLICLVYFMFCLLLSSISLAFNDFIFNLNDLKILFVIGILGGLAQWGFLQAFRMTAASILAPFDYFGLFWATLISYFLFNQIPDYYTVIGASIIIAVGLINIYYENKVTAKSA